MELRLLNACAQGNVRNLFPEDVWRLIEDTADQVRYQNSLKGGRTRAVHQVDVSDEVKDLREIVYKYITSQEVKLPVCGFCNSIDHKTDACPNMDKFTEDVNAIGNWGNNRQWTANQPPRGGFGLANAGYSWKGESSNHGQHNNNNQKPPNQPYQTPQRRQEHSSNNQNQPPKKPLDEIVEQLAETMRKNEERNDKKFGQIDAQLTQIATTVNSLQKP